MLELKGTLNTAKVFTELIEDEAIHQIEKMLSNEITKGAQVRIMPDVHAGKGSTIGTTIKLPENFEDWKVCPNVVGVDVGCGIMMYKLANKDIDLKKLDEVINAKIPSGFTVHNKPVNRKLAEEMLKNLSFRIQNKYGDRIIHSLGTLGGGNHFIELGVDEEGSYWLSVHSGSRNLGVQVAETHQKIAIDELVNNAVDTASIIDKMKKEGRHSEIAFVLKEIKEKQPEITKDTRDLAALQGELLKNYLRDMIIAQEFAQMSRMSMLDIIVKEMNLAVSDRFDSIHNFVEHDNFTKGTIRKGATSAKDGERLVIPLNMRDGALICIGRGNKDWNESAPHGAGRMMSRTKANKEIKLEDFRKQMEGIYSSSIGENTLDEAPDAYKPAESIIENIKDTVDVLHIVKPVYNFKAH